MKTPILLGVLQILSLSLSLSLSRFLSHTQTALGSLICFNDESFSLHALRKAGLASST